MSSGEQEEALTQREAARRLAITPKQLRRLTKQHGAPRNDDGSYPWPEVADWYKGFKQDEVLRRRGIDLEDMSYEQARARKEAAKAAQEELDLMERREQLIPLDVHVDRIADVAQQIRSRLMNLPGRYARELASAEDPEEATRLIEQGVRECLEELQRLEPVATNGGDGEG